MVFNKATGAWTAVSEIARGRGKGRAAVKAVGSALIAGAALLSAPGAIAQVLIGQPDVDGPINIGSSVTGGTVNFANVAGQNRRLTGIENGVGTTDAVTVNQLNGALTALGGGARINTLTGAVVAPTYTLGADSTGGTTYNSVFGALGNLDDRIKGNAASIATNTKNIANLDALAVKYDTNAAGDKLDSVTLTGGGTNGVAIKNVANGQVIAGSKDAVNGGQLFDIKSTADQAATKASNSVQYDGAGNTITLTNPTTGTGPVQIKNVAAGTNDTDAVNKSQLDSVKAVADNAVQYDSAAKDSVTLGNAGTPVKLSNVADGENKNDAVNFGQLSAANALNAANAKAVSDALGGGSTISADGKMTSPTYVLSPDPISGKDTFHNVGDALASLNNNIVSNAETIGKLDGLAVKYDTDATGAKLNSVTLDSGTSTTGVAIHNVASGDVAKDSKDAINGGQLFDVKSTAEQAVKAAANSVQYDAAGDTVTLKNPTTGTGPVQIKNVAAGTDDADAVNVKQLKDAGLVGSDGKLANAVTYDSDKKDSVTLGGLKDDGTGTGTMVPATAPVKLSNIANGVNANDAVNFSQLNGVGSALGGGAGFNNGVWTGPTYTFVDGSVHNNVGGALGNLDNRVGKLEGSISSGVGGAANDKFSGSGANNAKPGPKEEAVASGAYATASGANAVAKGQNSTATGANAQATAENSVALGAGSIADTANTVSVGSVGNERAITNVAEGTNPTDAVNKAQMDRQIAGVQNSVGNLQNQVSQIDSKVNRVGAMNAAMSTMMASAAGLQTDNRMAIGTGLYRGETALAVGYQRKVGSRATVTIGGSTAGGKEYNVGVGAGFGW